MKRKEEEEEKVRREQEQVRHRRDVEEQLDDARKHLAASNLERAEEALREAECLCKDHSLEDLRRQVGVLEEELRGKKRKAAEESVRSLLQKARGEWKGSSSSKPDWKLKFAKARDLLQEARKLMRGSGKEVEMEKELKEVEEEMAAAEREAEATNEEKPAGAQDALSFYMNFVPKEETKNDSSASGQEETMEPTFELSDNSIEDEIVFEAEEEDGDDLDDW